MKATIMLMALAIRNNEYTLDRVPSVLKSKVEKELAKLERDEQNDS